MAVAARSIVRIQPGQLPSGDYRKGDYFADKEKKTFGVD